MLKLKSLFQPKSAFLYLLAVFFVVHGFTTNYPSVPISDAIKLIIEYLLISLILAIPFLFIFKSSQNAVLFVFFLLLVQFFFGPLHDLLKNIFPHSFFSKYSFILPLFLIITSILFIFLLKSNKQFKRGVRYFTLTLILLIIVEGFLLFVKIFNHSEARITGDNFKPCNDCKTPNIYLIIADEYAGQEELKTIFSFNNSTFENELRKRNFYVVKKAMSNYNYTPYSMASIFSMNYLKGITDKSNDIDNRNISYQIINQNDLTNSLKNLGYNFVNLSLFDFAGKASMINDNEFYSTRAKLITSQTLTGRIKKDLWYNTITRFHFTWVEKSYQDQLIRNLEKQYNATLTAAEEKTQQPKFVYTHFIMPHYPYLFDKNGRKIAFKESMQDGRKDLYLEYLQYCNKQCLTLIDSILKKDADKPIIILMSDHGFTKYGPSVDPSYNFKNIINIYFPDGNYTGFPNSLSNVNLFRVVLNTKFKQQLPLLKDSTIFLKEY